MKEISLVSENLSSSSEMERVGMVGDAVLIKADVSKIAGGDIKEAIDVIEATIMMEVTEMTEGDVDNMSFLLCVVHMLSGVLRVVSLQLKENLPYVLAYFQIKFRSIPQHRNTLSQALSEELILIMQMRSHSSSAPA